MVHIKDEGSTFEAPIEVVWKYLGAQEHGMAHTGSRNSQMKPISENSFLLSMEVNMNGKWVKEVDRITNIPPLGMVVEMLEGPMAGSKMVNVYTPKGGHTQIDLYGEFNSSQIPAPMLEPAVRAMLEQMYNEDSKAIKTMASKTK